MLELVERDECAVTALLVKLRRQVEQRVQRRDRLDRRIDLDAGADAVGAERQSEPRALEQLVDACAERALELARVRTLEADRDVGDGHDAVEVDKDRDEALLILAVAERALEQARLAVLPRREQTDNVAADRGRRSSCVSSSRSRSSSGAIGRE